MGEAWKFGDKQIITLEKETRNFKRPVKTNYNIKVLNELNQEHHESFEIMHM